ncbi:MAG: hypothetical protein ABI261_04945 [Ginsengibacter sp.]
MMRNHLLICSSLLLLCIPVYLLDHYTAKSNGGNWITLDFSNLLIRAYVIFIGIEITISTIAIIYYHHSNLFKTHLFSAILSLAFIAIGLFLFDKKEHYSSAKKQYAIREHRKSYFNDIRLIRWWFLPDGKNPKEIHVDLVVASAGRLAAQASGNEDAENGKNIFSSDGQAQHVVKAGDTIHYVFPLTINNPGQANNVAFTFHLFKHPFGQSGDDDVSKIFKDSINKNDDGVFFYENLVPPMHQVTK